MKHTPNSTTHWACFQAMQMYGNNVSCCACLGCKMCQNEAIYSTRNHIPDATKMVGGEPKHHIVDPNIMIAAGIDAQKEQNDLIARADHIPDVKEKVDKEKWENWEKEFDEADVWKEEEWDSSVGDGGTYTALDYDKIVKFIRSLLTSQREYLLKEVEGMLEDEVTPRLGSKELVSAVCRNKFRAELRTALQKIKEKDEI